MSHDECISQVCSADIEVGASNSCSCYSSDLCYKLVIKLIPGPCVNRFIREPELVVADVTIISGGCRSSDDRKEIVVWFLRSAGPCADAKR